MLRGDAVFNCICIKYASGWGGGNKIFVALPIAFNSHRLVLGRWYKCRNVRFFFMVLFLALCYRIKEKCHFILNSYSMKRIKNKTNQIVFELSSSCCIHLNWHPSQCIAFDTLGLPDVFVFVAEVRTGIHHHYVWHLALWHCRVSMGGWKSKCGQEADWLPGQRTVAGKSFE